MVLFYIILNIYWGEWTNYGIDELLIRIPAKPVIFVSTFPVEKKELKEFIKSSTPVDSVGIWLKDRLSVASHNFELLEWDVGILEDSFSQQFILFGRAMSAGFMKLFVEGVAKFGDSCDYPSRRWQGILASDYLKGYIKISMFNFSLAVGREPIKWGPSPRNSLMLSGCSPPFDLIRGSYQNQKFKGSFFATALEQRGKINRYFSGHRIEYNPCVGLNIGGSEVALFGGEGKPPELYYLNPIFLYYPYQWNRKSDVNILWEFDFNLFLNGFGIYSELMIDDFPWKQSPRREHPKIGVNWGLRGTFSKIYWLAEYTTTTRWTYNHLVPWQQYTYLDFPIGHPIGPDFDELFLGVVHHLSRTMDIVFNTALVHKGEGTINEVYPDTFPKEYWLTGEIKEIGEFEIGIKWYRSIFVLTSKIGCIINENKVLPKLSFFISNWR